MALVNGKTLAAELGVSAMAISLARKRGRITFADAERKLYDRDTVLMQWHGNRERPRFPGAAAAGPGDAALLLAARRRREEALAAKAELDLARERGTVHDSKACIAGLQRDLANAKQRLMAIPTRAAAEVPPAVRVAVAEIVERLVQEALHEIGGSSDAENF